MKVLIGIPNFDLLIKEKARRRLINQGFEFIINESGHQADRAFLERWIGEVSAYIVGGEKVDNALLDKAINLRILARYGVGIDNIDIEHAKQKGIAISTTAGANASSVAEHTVMLMLATMRRVTYYQAAIAKGSWKIQEFPELSGKTVGLIGFGRIGQLVAKKLSGFTDQILVCDPARTTEEVAVFGWRLCSLDQLLQSSDVVSLHLPSVDGKPFLGRSELSLMKNSAILVNTARGSLVDEDALFESLLNGKLAGAGLDVVTLEPCASNNRLLTLTNTVITPHIAGGSWENHEKAGDICAENIIRTLFPEKSLKGEIL